MTVKSSSTRGTKKAPRRSRSRLRSDALERLQHADAQLAERLPPSTLAAFAADAEQAATAIGMKWQSASKRSPITGEPHPAPAEMARIRRQSLYRAFTERGELLQGAMSVAQVAEMLGVGRQTPHDRARAGRLLAIRDNGRLIFPDWQFDPEGPDGVIAGLPAVLKALEGPISPLGRIRWFLRPKALLGGRAPLDALRAGDIQDVVIEAAAVGVS
jgi:hypothetical protein